MIYIHVITNFSDVGGAEEMLIRYVNEAAHTEHIIISLMSVTPLMTNKLNKKHKIVSLNCKNFIDLLVSVYRIIKILSKESEIKVYSWMYHANVVTALSKLFSSKNFSLIWGVRHSLDDLSGEKFSTKIAIYAGESFENNTNKGCILLVKGDEATCKVRLQL